MAECVSPRPGVIPGMLAFSWCPGPDSNRHYTGFKPVTCCLLGHRDKCAGSTGFEPIQPDSKSSGLPLAELPRCAGVPGAASGRNRFRRAIRGNTVRRFATRYGCCLAGPSLRAPALVQRPGVEPGSPDWKSGTSPFMLPPQACSKICVLCLKCAGRIRFVLFVPLWIGETKWLPAMQHRSLS